MNWIEIHRDSLSKCFKYEFADFRFLIYSYLGGSFYFEAYCDDRELDSYKFDYSVGTTEDEAIANANKLLVEFASEQNAKYNALKLHLEAKNAT